VRNYRISSEALFDIAEIWRYIARDSFDQADLVEEAIYSNCAMVGGESSNRPQASRPYTKGCSILACIAVRELLAGL
jgi:plasmid stabilization system protein ParE